MARRCPEIAWTANGTATDTGVSQDISFNGPDRRLSLSGREHEVMKSGDDSLERGLFGS